MTRSVWASVMHTACSSNQATPIVRSWRRIDYIARLTVSVACADTTSDGKARER